MNTNLAYQEELWEELIDGESVLMSTRPAVKHSFVAGNIYYIFMRYLRGKRCTPFLDGVDLYLSETDRFIPDCMIVCDRGKIKSDGVHGAPDLVVEVLSFSTAKNDRLRKKNAYEKAGVREYWIVDPNNKTIEQYFLREGQFIPNERYALLSAEDLKETTPEERETVLPNFGAVFPTACPDGSRRRFNRFLA